LAGILPVDAVSGDANGVTLRQSTVAETTALITSTISALLLSGAIS
jgi:hypothetical protein